MEKLNRLLNPRSVTVVGGDDAELVINELCKFGYSGKIWPINRCRDTLGDLLTYRSIAELPSIPDAAFVGVSAENSIPVIKELSEIGCGGAIVFAAGFSECGRNGEVLQQELLQAAADMPLLGPNCYGFINAKQKLALWPYFQGCDATKYGPALISQSGMLATSLTMNRRSVDFSYVISVGNQASTSIEDYIEALVHDDSVSSFAVYQESCVDFKKLQDVAKIALYHHKPIVMIKAGNGKTAKQVCTNHTGAISESIDIDLLRLKELGVIFVDSPSQLLETVKMTSHKEFLLGSKMLAFTCSGGDAALLADNANGVGIEFPSPSERVRRTVQPLIPKIATISNPMDCTTQLWGKPQIREIFSEFLSDRYDIALFVQDYPKPEIDFDYETDFEEMKSFIKAARSKNLPAIICSSISENLNKKVREEILRLGGIPLQGIGEAVRAIAHTISYKKIHQAYHGNRNLM